MNNKIVIVGFGGHAKSLADSIMADGKYEIAGYTELEEKCEFERKALQKTF